MNKVFLIGNLTRDPEMRSTQSGVPVCNFSIAVNRRFRNAQTGQQETDFLNIVAWRQLAELCGRYLTKGRKVAVVGSIQTRTYEAQDGSKRSAFDIVADEVEFLSANQNGGAPSGVITQHRLPPLPRARKLRLTRPRMLVSPACRWMTMNCPFKNRDEFVPPAMLVKKGELPCLKIVEHAVRAAVSRAVRFVRSVSIRSSTSTTRSSVM